MRRVPCDNERERSSIRPDSGSGPGAVRSLPASGVGLRMGLEGRPRNRRVASPACCPTCGNDLLVLVYGYPSPELSAEAARGEVVLGGCCVMADGTDASHHCRRCAESCVVHPRIAFPIDSWRIPRVVVRSTEDTLALVLLDGRGLRLVEITKRQHVYSYFESRISAHGYRDFLACNLSPWNEWRERSDEAVLKLDDENLSGLEHQPSRAHTNRIEDQ